MGGRSSTSGLNGGNYQSFPDVPGGWRSTHEFDGSGQDQVDFFDQYSNYNEIINSLNVDEQGAIRDWSQGMLMGDQYDGWDRMSDWNQIATQHLDDILDKTELTRGVILARRTDAQFVMGRGTKRAGLKDLRAHEGEIVSCNANLSFAAASQGLTIGDSGKRNELRLHLPPSKGSGMWIGDTRVNPWGTKQREFIMNRDVNYRIGKTIYDGIRNIYVTDIYYVGREAHDYGTTGRF